MRVRATNSPHGFEVTTDGTGVVGHAGAASPGHLNWPRLEGFIHESWPAGVVIAPGGGRRVVMNSGPTLVSDLGVGVAGAEVREWRSRVELFEQIRKDRRVEGTSIRELTGRHHVHQRTVRQALDPAVPAHHQQDQQPQASQLALEPGLDADH